MQIFIEIGIVGLNIIYFFIKLFPTKNKITLISRQSNDASIDFKLIIDRIHKELPKYQVVVLTKEFGKNKVLDILYLFKQMYHISTSKIVILDTYCIPISILRHKKRLKVIQIWHAIGLMKKAGYSVLDKAEGRSSKMAKVMRMHKNYDYIFTSADSCKKAFTEVFNYPENYMVTIPLPRVDLLRDVNYMEEKRKEIIAKYPQLGIKKNILYAPTHRKDETLFEIKTKELIDAIDYEKYNLIIKLHSLSKINIDNDNVVLDKQFSTMEMGTVSDYVIVDYSGVLFEIGVLRKPLYIYTFDYDEYGVNRGIFIDYANEIPGKMYENGKDIFNAITREEHDMVKQDVFINKYVDLSSDDCTGDIVNFIKTLIN